MDQPRVGAGVGIMLLRNGKILLGKRHDNPEKAKSALKGAGTWSMPGGKLRFGETFEQAAQRELLEETSMIINNPRIICVNNDIVEGAHFITIGVFSDTTQGEPKTLEPDEITEWRWFPLDKLPKPLFFASDEVLQCYREKAFYKKRS